MKVNRSSFLTINFYCLPHPIKGEERKFQKLYKRLHEDTVSTAIYFGELGVNSEADMLNLFHPDLMSYGLGTEVKVVIENIPLAAEKRRNNFLRDVMQVIKDIFPDARKIIGEAHPESSDDDMYLILEDH